MYCNFISLWCATLFHHLKTYPETIVLLALKPNNNNTAVSWSVLRTGNAGSNPVMPHARNLCRHSASCSSAKYLLAIDSVEVHRLLSVILSKSSPLDVLPCSLPKACTATFSPVIALPLSHQSSPSSPTYRCRMESFRRDSSTTKEGWARPLIARELQAHIQSVNRLEDPWKTSFDTPASSSARVNQLQEISVCVPEGTLDGNSAAGDPRRSVYCGRWQAGYCPHQCRSVDHEALLYRL